MRISFRLFSLSTFLSFSLAVLMDEEAITAAFGAPLLERAVALGSLLSTLWPDLLQLSVPAKLVLATIGEGA